MLKRFSYYGFGFGLGLILLIFFLNGKRASCSFFPNERVLGILRSKPCIYSEEALAIMNSNNIDSVAIASLLLDGSVDFSKSKTRQQPCRYYWVDGTLKNKNASLYIKNCDTIITIEQISLNN